MTPRKRDEHFEERRQRIVEAAGRVFAERGFSGATNRQIAEAAGISPGLIYWYFESKEELFVAILEQLTPIRSIEIPVEVADSLPVDQFFEMIARSFLRAAAQPEVSTVFRLVMGEVLRFPEPAQQIGTLLARHPIGYVSAYVERQIAAGRIRQVDPWLTAQAFLGSLVGYVVRKRVLQHGDIETVDDDVMAATVARLFTHGLLAGPGQDAHASAGMSADATTPQDPQSDQPRAAKRVDEGANHDHR